MTGIEAELLEVVRLRWEQHAAECQQPPYLILLNPANYELLGWDEILGLPVLPDDRIDPMKCRIVCGTEGWAGRWGDERVWWIDEQPHLVKNAEEVAAA
jgi:hypothetical protein